MNIAFDNRLQRLQVFFLLCFVLTGCGLFEPADEGPNEVGGDTNVDFVQVGKTFGAFLDLSDQIPGGYTWHDSITVLRNENGMVTMDVDITTDYDVLKHLDTLFGTSALPRQTRLLLLDSVAARFGATIDTSIAGMLRVHARPVFKVTTSGIQEYVSSNGDVTKPFTIIKYNANVGDSWTFTRPNGRTVRRTVTYHSTTDDYPVGFWLLKVFKTESIEENDPLIDKIVFVTNHKYGTVGAIIHTKNGNQLRLGIIPPTL